MGIDALPFIGTLSDIKEAVNNPSDLNKGIAAASVAGDLLIPLGVGVGVKAAVSGAKTTLKLGKAAAQTAETLKQNYDSTSSNEYGGRINYINLYKN